MNRPWTACAVMLIAMGGLLLAVGAESHRMQLDKYSGNQSLSRSNSVVFCDWTVPGDRLGYGRYEDGCGYDRTNGIRYRQPASRRGWSMIAEQQLASTMVLIRTLKSTVRTDSESPSAELWPATAVLTVHPAAPPFYNDHAARSYAAAQGQAWRESSQPLMVRTVSAREPMPMLRLELCPAKSSWSWGLGDPAMHLNSVVRTIRRYPAEHNARITWLALQNRFQTWIDKVDSLDGRQLVSDANTDFRKSAKVLGFGADEYEELVDRAMEKLPAPDKIETPRQFRPAPSRQSLLRMASATLQRMSDLLDATAIQLEHAAGGEVAARGKRTAKH